MFTHEETLNHIIANICGGDTDKDGIQDFTLSGHCQVIHIKARLISGPLPLGKYNYVIDHYCVRADHEPRCESYYKGE
jgi:hypothetical protein